MKRSLKKWIQRAIGGATVSRITVDYSHDKDGPLLPGRKVIIRKATKEEVGIVNYPVLVLEDRGNKYFAADSRMAGQRLSSLFRGTHKVG